MDIIFIIVLMILLGWFLKSRNILSESAKVPFNSLVLNVAMPATIFLSMTRSIEAGQLPEYLSLTVIMITGTGIMMSIAWVFGKYVLHLAPASLYAFMLICGIGNTGFMGYPICSGYFGDPGLTRAVFCDASTTITMVTASAILGMKLSGQRRNIIHELVKFPVLLTWIGSIILILAGFKADMLPEIIISVLEMIASVTTPLIMISVGLSLSAKHIKNLIIPNISTCAFRLIITPIIVFGLLLAFGIEDLSRTVTVIEAGMPCAMAIMIFAEIYGMDRKLISGATFLATIFSLATIPAIVYIMENL